MKDRQLVQSIKNGFKEHRITSVHGNDINTMIDRFMSYTPLARDYIMNYYSQLDKTEKAMNWIVKTDFERKYFYISGTDALIAMMLLGFKVNHHRQANVSMKSQKRLAQQDEYLKSREEDFFKRNNLTSSDINSGWYEWHAQHQ